MGASEVLRIVPQIVAASSLVSRPTKFRFFQRDHANWCRFEMLHWYPFLLHCSSQRQ
jgi:hypothetical protein